jgi:predicted ATPase
VAKGEPDAIADLLTGLSLSAGSGSQIGAPAIFALLGGAYMTTGQLIEAGGTVETGLALAAQTGQPFFDSELHRLQGEIVLASGGALAEAEVHFDRALGVARAQEAKSFELRSAISLARLRRDQSRRAEARDLLTPLCAWFTEGFDIADLKDARALLDDLAR